MLMLSLPLLASMLALHPEPPARVDIVGLRAALEAAPEAGEGVLVWLPTAHAGDEPFEAWSSPVMAPELGAKHPQIRTYAARGLREPGVTARIDLSQNGLHAIVLRGGRGELLSAVPGDPGLVTRGLVGRGYEGWECLVPAGMGAGAPVWSERGPLTLRRLRAAVACTGEFTTDASAAQGRAPNLADGLAAVVTMVNRANALLERDVAVRLELVPNNDLLIFLNPATDPYSGTNSGANLSANISTCSSRIGNTNFDIGHVLTRIPGGVAYLQAPCTNNRAGGVSGLPRTDTGDPFDPQVLMHELGHQLGANHTFNGSIDRCLNNRNGSTAWEPGSGTTILSYAGGCPVGNVPPGDNIVINRDVMYHSGSLLEMRAWLAGGGATCGSQLAVANQAPLLDSMPPATGLAIPTGTPFELSAAVSDPNGDGVTNSWEQFDLGPQQPLTGADNGLSPLFRCFAPRAEAARVFPQWSDILGGVATPGERLPQFTPATRKFRLVARDNFPGAGGVTISHNIEVQVVQGTGPFVVTAPATGQVRTGRGTVRWDVAGTSLAPLSVTQVRIDLSLDGGATFGTVLSESEPNDGEASVDFPAADAAAARVRVRAIGGIFFAVSGEFTLLACEPDYSGDGTVDQDDVSRLISIVAGGPNDQGLDPDFNRDGAVDQDDVTSLVHTVAGGGCP
ncbi:MAG: hypothetical protein IT433_02600 [Phycisphaerales bacterium]|nr:hypothetical protein [Phycisphaerales bacterium]